MSRDNERPKDPAEASEGEQLALIRETVRKAKGERARPRTWRGAKLAGELPVARVLVDKGPVHLDKLWDYAVPAEMDAEARPLVD
ncbi:primosome assembly protein PriA, partial [Streptomyces sp. WAC05858]